MKKKDTGKIPKKNISNAGLNLTTSDFASALIDNTSDAISAINLKGEILFWNNGAVKLSGYSKDEVLGKHISLLYRKQDIPALAERIKKALQGEDFTNKELILIDKNKKEHTVLLTLNGLKDETGKVAWLVGFTKDITEQNKSEIELLKVKEKAEQVEQKLTSQLESTLNNISDGFVSLDTNWFYTYVNIKAAEFLGRSQEDLIGKHIWTEFPEGVGLPFYNAYYKAVDTQQTQYFEEYYEPFDKWFENRVYPSPKGLTIYFTDITEKKKAETNNQMLLSLIETSDDFIGLATLEGKPIYLNTNGRKLVGLETDVKKQISISEFFPENYQDKIVNEHIPTIYKNNKWDGKAEFQNYKTGNRIPIEMSGFLIKDIATKKPIALGIVAKDVTERKNAEDGLRSSEKKFRNLSETAHVAIAILGAASGKKFLYVNAYWESLTGYSKEEAKGLDILHVVAPEHRAMAGERAAKRIVGGQVPERYELKLITKSGDTKWVNFSATLTEFDGDKAILTTALDITEKKQAEIELINAKEKAVISENYLDNIINNIGDPFFVKDEQSRIILVNDAFCTLFDLTRDNIIGKTLAEDVSPEEKEHFLRIDRQVLKTGKENIIEEPLTVRGGRTKTISTKKSRYIDSKGKKYLIGVIRDISERIKDEKQLQESKAKFEILSNVTFEGILIHDKGVPIDMNNSLPQMFGYTKDEFIDADLIKLLIHKDYNSIVNENIKNEYQIPYEVVGIKKDGTEFPIEIEGRTYISEENNKYRVTAIRNKTDRKIAEERLTESEKKFSKAFDSAPYPVTITNFKTGERLAVNNALCKFFGYSKSELLNSNFFKNNKAADELELKKVVKKLLKDGSLVEYPFLLKTKSREVKHVLVNSTKLYPNNEDIYITSYFDFTERKKFELKLKESEANISAILNSLPASVCVIGETGEIIEVNDSWKNFGDLNGMPGGTDYITDYNYFDVCKTDFQDNDAKSILKGLLGLLQNKTNEFEFEYPCHSSDRKQWFLLRANLMISREKQIVISHIDITSRVLAEKHLEDTLDQLTALKQQIEAENIYLKEELKLEGSFNEIVGSSKSLKKVLKQVEQVAKTDTTVLVLGETGTGKELIARAIHNASDRKDKSMVKVNCSALPAELIESELFGHEKGAFTGALNRKIGRFELANGGTIFLDEIGDIPIGLQTRLLRVLQESEFERVGGEQTIKVNVRVVTATNRNLEDEVKAGNFRNDLYYRLNVFPITCPALRDRIEDVPSLMEHFVNKYNPKVNNKIKSINQKTIDKLMTYKWPGNIRELEHVIERAVIINQGGQLSIGNWFQDSNLDTVISDDLTSLETVEREHIIKVLEKTNWKIRGKNGAAEILGMQPTTLESRMKKRDISR